MKLRLSSGTRARGRVVDGAGKPLVGASVVVQTIPADDLPDVLTTDEEGRFESKPFPPGKFQVYAQMPGYADAGASLLWLRNDISTALEIVKKKAASVSGRVISEAGKPLSGAEVGLFRAERGDVPIAVLPARLPLANAAADANVVPSLTWRSPMTAVFSVFTNEDGRFHAGGLSAGRYLLRASHPDTLPMTLPTLSVEVGSDRQLGEVRLPSGGTVEGLVQDEMGTAVSGSQVSIRSSTVDGGGRVVADLITGDDGKFSFLVPPGRYALTASSSGRVSVRPIEVSIAEAENKEGLRLLLDAATGKISGHVKGPESALLKALGYRCLPKMVRGPLWLPAALVARFWQRRAPTRKVALSWMGFPMVGPIWFALKAHITLMRWRTCRPTQSSGQWYPLSCHLPAASTVRSVML